MQPSLKAKRQAAGFTALEFSNLIKSQIPTMTEMRLYQIETGRLRARPEERELICRLLNCKAWEIQL